jgi:hypothetical protein
MKRLLAKYMLYIYLNFIKYDLTIFKDWAIPIIKTLNKIQSIIVWISAVVFFPIFIIGMIIDITFLGKV